jgi:ribonuclease HI
METVVMYTDGGSRGNPGPSALGVFLETLDVRFGEFLGTGTNNEAEYAAILSGMKRAVEIVGTTRAREMHLECRMDSELAMRQLTGRYRVKHPHMKHWFSLIQEEIPKFAKVSFHHVPREENKEADRMVNEALDKAAGEQKQ